MGQRWLLARITYRIHFYYTEGIALVWSHFFGSNSGKLEPIGTKFYTETSVCREHSPLQTFGALRQTGTKRRWKFCELFVTNTTHLSTHFPTVGRELRNFSNNRSCTPKNNTHQIICLKNMVLTAVLLVRSVLLRIALLPLYCVIRRCFLTSVF